MDNTITGILIHLEKLGTRYSMSAEDREFLKQVAGAINWRDASLMAMGTENDALRAVLYEIRALNAGQGG